MSRYDPDRPQSPAKVPDPLERPRFKLVMDGLIEEVDSRHRHLQVRVHDVLKTFSVPTDCTVIGESGTGDLNELHMFDRVLIRCSPGPGPLRADTIRVYPRLRLISCD